MAAGLQLDSLYCQEDTLWVSAEYDTNQPPPAPPAPVEDDEEQWAELLASLAVKERETHPHIPHGLCSDDPAAAAGDPYLRHARRGAVEWVCRACARHGFSALTALLAVSYLDRCFLPAAGGLTLQGDRPWMERLSAVACLSLAAKVEETYVPLLLDLQAVGEDEEVVAAASGGGGYVFEPKTVRRMELLVLSALKWRMNPVTPLSFIHHLLPKLATTTAGGGGGQLLWSCHTILLSLIADWRWVRYPPSVWAAAALLHATTGQSGHHDESILALLSLTKGSVEGCYQLISDTMAGACISISSNKRNYYQFSYPPSPNGVIDTACFSYDSASSTIGGECWITTTTTAATTTMWPLTVSSSLDERPFKRPNYTLG